MRWLLTFLALAAFSLAFVACGDDDDDDGGGTPTAASTTPAGGGGGSTIDVALQDYSINADPTTVDAGEVEFDITNNGPSVHEFVLIKTDLAADDLPTDSDGAVEEDGGDIEVIDEAEDVAVDGTASFSADLEAGHYVYICNIVEEEGGSTVAHYTNGMRGELTVE
jgi:hypothetical protein